VLLDTGVSFPIGFEKARIFGEEVSLQVPHWWRFSGFLSYSNQAGYGQGPVTGGLFLGTTPPARRRRHRVLLSRRTEKYASRARAVQSSKRTWVAISGDYGSGLPVELDAGNVDLNFLFAQYGPAITGKVNFDRGRVAPNFSLGAAAGWEVYRKGTALGCVAGARGKLLDRVNVRDSRDCFQGRPLLRAQCERTP